MNNILNIGEIINLFTFDDKENLLGDFKDIISKEQKEKE